MILLVLFKLKTAYEMRISDSSSDVCSSDLAAFNYRQLSRLVPAHAWKFYLQSRKLELPADPVDDKLVNAVTEIIDALPTVQREVLYAEIGRASCRERVCQYV